jgi:probable HAF family extracellular repeat protein
MRLSFIGTCNTLLLASLLVGLSSPSSHAGPIAYAITDIGVLSGDLESSAIDINNHGQTLVISSGGDSGRRDFVFDFKSGFSTPLGDRFYGSTINDTGEVSRGRINNAGWSAIFEPGSGNIPSQTFLEGPGGRVPIGDPSIGFLPNGINGFGQVVGYGGDGKGHFPLAYIFSDNRLTQLPIPAGQGYGMPTAINDKGQIVMDAGGPGAAHAYLLTDGEFTDLGTLGGEFSHAADIDSGGRVVGSSAVGGESHAFLYMGGAMYDLNDLIPPETGWVLTEARAINDAGQIVGRGMIDGRSRAFLLNPEPVTTPVPEPSSLLTLLAGPALIALRGWLRSRPMRTTLDRPVPAE